MQSREIWSAWSKIGWEAHFGVLRQCEYETQKTQEQWTREGF
jgi:hypothetical protein